jgi:hypothetical protein
MPLQKTELGKLKDLVKATGWKGSVSLQTHTIIWLKESKARLSGEDWVTLSNYLAQGLDITIERLTAIFRLTKFEEVVRALTTPRKILPKDKEDMVYPTTGWLGAYLDYSQGNEAPGAFHFWTGVALLGAACKRNFYIDQGSYFIYPNQYILIIAPSGAKKSSSLAIGNNLLESLNLMLTDEGVDEADLIKIAPKRLAPERFVYSLQAKEVIDPVTNNTRWADSVAFFGVTELVVLLGKSVFHSDQFVHLLTELWDCPEEYPVSTFVRGDEVLRNVAVSLVACTTESWLYEATQEDIFTGGFMGRCVVVPRGYTNKFYPIPAPLDPIQRNELAKWLIPLATAKKTAVQITAWDWYRDWYKKNKEATAVCTDKKMEGYYNRRDVHLMKLALVLSKSEGHGAILQEDLEVALKILEHEEKFLPQVLNNVGVHP